MPISLRSGRRLLIRTIPLVSLHDGRFDAELLKANIRTTLQTKLGGATWDKRDKEKNRRLSTELADGVKSKMLGE